MGVRAGVGAGVGFGAGAGVGVGFGAGIGIDFGVEICGCAATLLVGVYPGYKACMVSLGKKK